MLISLPAWAGVLEKRWRYSGVPDFKKQAALLKKGIRLLEESRSGISTPRSALPEQPFDAQLLSCSPLFRRSRKLYLKEGGKFKASLVSSPRTLSSPVLLDAMIEYSPIENELIWLATDEQESKVSDRLLELRTYCSSLFHEQNHRILWSLLPVPPKTKDGLRRFLNFAESLVITLDMALADQLGPRLATLFYLVGVTYDPGTSVYLELRSRREYRNYLQAALHATYLNLEFYEPKDIPKAIQALFPSLGEFGDRAAQRSGNLDRLFVHRTNPRWQTKHRATLFQKLCTPGRPVLDLPSDPMDQRQQYLIAEAWFDLLGV